MHTHNRATFYKRTFTLHWYNHKFAIEPCGQGILYFCHKLDHSFSFYLLNNFGMGRGVLVLMEPLLLGDPTYQDLGSWYADLYKVGCKLLSLIRCSQTDNQNWLLFEGLHVDWAFEIPPSQMLDCFWCWWTWQSRTPQGENSNIPMLFENMSLKSEVSERHNENDNKHKEPNYRIYGQFLSQAAGALSIYGYP